MKLITRPLARLLVLMCLMVLSASSFAACGGGATVVAPNTFGAIYTAQDNSWCASPQGYYYNTGPDVFNGCQVTSSSTQTSSSGGTSTASTAPSVGVSTAGVTYTAPVTTTTTTTTTNTTTNISYHLCPVPPGYATNMPRGQGALRNGNTFINMGPTAWGNIALGKPTQQSSTYTNSNNFTSGQAVDGNSNTFTHTNNGAYEWWIVDFQARYQINKIRINNRPDCCQERLTNATVEVLNQDGGLVWSETAVVNAGQSSKPFWEWDLPSLPTGRYVRVKNWPGQYLSISEVQVNGSIAGQNQYSPEVTETVFKNNFSGQGLCLDNGVFGGIPIMRTCSTPPPKNQVWAQGWLMEYVSPTISGKPYAFRLRSTNDGKCLDIQNDAQRNKFMVAACNNASGQIWYQESMSVNGVQIAPFRNLFSGAGKCMDIINDPNRNILNMANCGNYSGQNWSWTGR